MGFPIFKMNFLQTQQHASRWIVYLHLNIVFHVEMLSDASRFSPCIFKGHRLILSRVIKAPLRCNLQGITPKRNA